MEQIHLASVVEDPWLVGKLKGCAHFTLLAPYLKVRGPVVLDFDGVFGLSSSYFFAALWPFWIHQDEAGPSLFPLIANADPEGVLDELNEALGRPSVNVGAWKGRWSSGAFSPDGWTGSVEDIHRLALDEVTREEEISAADLAKQDDTRPTTWNNRLATLHEQRLICQSRTSGRKKYYSASWREN
jgi:hypothetical protein